MAVNTASFELGTLFQAVGEALRGNRESLNQADRLNGNHGDHMLAIFDLAAVAARERAELELGDAMEYAGRLLETLPDNGSARLYARGLEQMAVQFRHYGISLEDLVRYVDSALVERNEGAPKSDAPARSGDVLKALMSGLAAWSQIENGQQPGEKLLDMGVLFEFGMAYMQARQRGGSRIEVIADAACSVSPLSQTPHRYESGKLAIQALLRAMQASAPVA